MKASALRPLRVGITQSNRSTPWPDRFEQIDRPADAHQVARAVAAAGGAGVAWSVWRTSLRRLATRR